MAGDGGIRDIVWQGTLLPYTEALLKQSFRRNS